MPARSLLTSLLLAALQHPAAALSTPCRWQLRASVGRTKGMTTSMPDAWGKSGNCLPITVDVDVFGTPAAEKDERVGAGAAKLEPRRSEISITGFGGAVACVKVQSGQCPSSAPVPPQGAPGGSGQLGTRRKRPARWAPSHCLGRSS